ncbi:MAG TPA: DUF4164 family protein [Kiloniellales bacterium]|jgi:hypothetical protein
MAQLEQATKRLQAALDRLEQAVDARATNGGDRDNGDELRAALAAAQKENAALQKAAGSVATRLDVTIAQLKATLEA